MRANRITALIGPSGCGKSTFLRNLNRINDTIRNARMEGQVLLDNEDVRMMDVTSLRRRVGMVFQRPNPFPKSIYDNIAYGLRVNGMVSRSHLRDRVEQSLKRAALWEEVKDKLHDPPTPSPAASSSASASLARWPWIPKCSSSTSRARLSIR